MKKSTLIFVIGLILLTMVACSGETTTELVTTELVTEALTSELVTDAPTTEMVYDNHISVVIGSETYLLGYNTEDDHSLLDLIEASGIHLSYNTTEYGAMVLEIGDFTQDEFHWIGFTVNDEFAMSGIDSIDYLDGDVFEFTQNLTSWEMTLEATALSFNESFYTFSVNDYLIQVPLEDISEEVITGERYSIVGMPQSEDGLDIGFSLSSCTPISYEGYITIKLGTDLLPLTYEDQSQSVLDLIEASEIQLTYIMTDFGAMVLSIGSFEQDDFHWIGFTKNNEFAMSGIDSISYENGDVFEFSENLVSWEISLTAELVDVNDDFLVFENNNQAFSVNIDELPVGQDVESLVAGFIYEMTGTPNAESTDKVNIFSPTSMALDLINDFTDLYDLEEGQVFILEFTVTFIEDSSAFGTEIFASDVNGLLSQDISSYMAVSSDTDYIFYTIPDGYTLSLGETYIGRFIYQVNAPSSVPQLTLYEKNINGEDLTNIIIQK